MRLNFDLDFRANLLAIHNGYLGTLFLLCWEGHQVVRFEVIV